MLLLVYTCPLSQRKDSSQEIQYLIFLFSQHKKMIRIRNVKMHITQNRRRHIRTYYVKNSKGKQQSWFKCLCFLRIGKTLKLI